MLLLNKTNEKQYLQIMKNTASDAGYNPDELSLAHDGIHKLKYNNIKFGNIDYPDFILFIMNKQIDEAIKRRKNYLTRTANMRGNWKDNKYSKNNLSRRIIWFLDELNN
jgi:hypothetical protein